MNEQISTSPIKRIKRYRSENGTSRPYLDQGRYKVVGYAVTSSDGKVKVVGSGKTRAAAIASLARLIQEKRGQYQLGGTDLSAVPDYCQHWLNNIRGSDLRNKTRVGYQAAIDHWIRPALENVKLSQLKREHIQGIYAEVERKGRSRSTVTEIRTVLNQSLEEAVLSGLIPINPVRTVKIPKRIQNAPVYFKDYEVVQIRVIAVALGSWANWGLALLCGLRQGERLALHWDDLDLGINPTVTIRGSLSRVTGKGLVVDCTKTNSSVRTIPLSEELAEALRVHKRTQNEKRLSIGPKWHGGGFVFTTPNGMPIDPANDRKAWVQLLKRSQVPYRKLHAARHTTATLMCAQGVSLLTVSKILGHSSINTTAEFYAHVLDDSKLDAVNRLAMSLES